MTLALSFWAGWGAIAVTLAVLLVFYKVLDLSAEAFTEWWNAAPGQGEDSSANRERETSDS